MSCRPDLTGRRCMLLQSVLSFSFAHSRAAGYRPSSKTDSSRSRPAFTDPHRESFGARCPASQPGTGGITFYTPARRTRFSRRVAAVEATRRSGREGGRLTWLLFRPGWKKNAPFASSARWQGRLPTTFPKKASESSLQAMVRLGTSSRSRYTGLGTEGTRGAPPRSHRPIQVRRTQAS